MCEELQERSPFSISKMVADSLGMSSSVARDGILNTTSYTFVESQEEGRNIFETTLMSKITVIHEEESYIDIDNTSLVESSLTQRVEETSSMLGNGQIPPHMCRSVSYTSITSVTCPGFVTSSTTEVQEITTSLNTETAETSGSFLPVIRSGCYEDRGPRSYMEDVHLSIDDVCSLDYFHDFPASERQAFYGVFDGHGGAGAAHFVRKHLLQNVVQDPSFPGNIGDAFRAAFKRTDIQYEAAWRNGQEEGSGTTALTLFLSGRSVVVANAGDCRAVLCRNGKAFELSCDHKPFSPSEKARIVAAKGTVDGDGYLNGQLSVARALGNWHLEGLKAVDSEETILGPLISEPEVKETELTPEDEFIILACDGLWDVMESQVAVAFARERLQDHNDPQKCSQELVEKALKRSSDNLTVVTICLKADPPPKIQRKPWRPGVKRSVSVDSLCKIQRFLNDCS